MNKKRLDLQKENTELEEKYADLEKKYFNNITDCDWCDTYCNSQLIKAKELIELFVQWNYGCCKIPDLKDIVKQAEQFLKE